MSRQTMLGMDQERLVKAWQETLPTTLNPTDSVDVKADEANSRVLRIHIITAGHSKYSFDFSCTYVDDREVKVELIDVEKDNRSVDEHNDVIQTLAEDYVRHIHECAQLLHPLTHGQREKI